MRVHGSRLLGVISATPILLFGDGGTTYNGYSGGSATPKSAIPFVKMVVALIGQNLVQMGGLSLPFIYIYIYIVVFFLIYIFLIFL
jgi:hypothetical protein